MSKKMTSKAARRIQSTTAKQGGGKVASKSFAARATRVVAKGKKKG